MTLKAIAKLIKSVINLDVRAVLSYLLFLGIKYSSKVFFKLQVSWISENRNFDDIRLVILLNHTSLYEPIYLSAAPNDFIWKISKKMVAPAADKTLNRPIVGRIWKFVSPGLISITRRRDKSWFQFLEAVKNKCIIIIAPEGRMKRHHGRDSKGKPMSVRSGVAEIIAELNEGNVLIAYSGGLHHIQHPGELYPRLFKKISLSLEKMTINDYKNQFQSEGIQFRKDVVADLERRLATNCPKI